MNKKFCFIKTTKKKINEEKAEERTFCDKWNINIKLVKEHDDDIKLASLMKYSLKGMIID